MPLNRPLIRPLSLGTALLALLVWLIAQHPNAHPSAAAGRGQAGATAPTDADAHAASAAPLLALAVAAQSDGSSEDKLWQYVTEETARLQAAAKSKGRVERRATPKVYRTVRLNLAVFARLRQQAPLELTEAAKQAPLIISLPLPDGNFARFRIEESPIMEPGLARKYPDVKTYRGQGVDDPTATMRLSWTDIGLSAMIRGQSGTIYIDPYARGDNENYITYRRRDLPKDGKQFQCNVEAQAEQLLRDDGNRVAVVVNGGTLRTYRLAMAARGEYTAFFRQPGDTDAQARNRAMMEVMRIVDRLNEIYETEVSVHFNLVANNDTIIYVDAATDPYMSGDGSTAIQAENQTNLDATITNANYDLGHVVGASNNSGRGDFTSLCMMGTKARGTTGRTNPVGDPFIVDFVAHEIGHQFNARHTFNSNSAGSCTAAQREPNSAYEPGSGSTIMGYAGICTGADLQGNSDDYFHVGSLEQIVARVGAAGCGATPMTGNTPPNVNAGPDFTIPRNTPFVLTATGSDPNGDALTFCWEEYDAGGNFPNPPYSDAGDPPTTTRPLFRSYEPVASPSRFFPSLQFIRNNANNPPATTGGFITGEILPSVTRTMRFQVTARDRRAGGGGIRSDEMQVMVDAGAGPFVVTVPNGGEAWPIGVTRTVTWNVANTTAAPVSAANVRILLSLDDGLTFPIVLVASTPNDGSESVVVPSNPTTMARIKVEAVGNIFFDISDAPFVIRPEADLAITKADAPDPVIAGNNLTYTLNVSNAGPNDAANVVVAESVPTGTTLISGTVTSGTGWTFNPGTVSFTKAVMAVGETATFQVVVRVDSCLAGNTTLSNTATIGSATFDPVTSNNSATEPTNVVRRAELILSKTDAPDPVIAGTNLTYTINVTNNGPSCAANLTISDTIPANTRLVSATPSAGGTVLTAATVTAVWAGDTAVGGTRSLTIVVRVCPEVVCNTIISNTATTSSDSVDLNPGNNSATVTTTAQTQSDIAITNTATPNPVIAGQNVTYTLNITNAGPSNSANTIVADVLPKGFTVVSLNTTLGTVTATATDPVTQQVTVTANLGVLGAANQCATSFPTTATVTIVANVPMKYPVVIVTNAATVATDNCLPDPNLADNAASFDTTVFPLSNDPGLPIFATTEASDQKAGSVLVYNLYASSTTAPSSENTRINLTNISAHEDIAVHLFFVDGQTCSVADAYVCLTKNQTTSFLASDIDPGTRGYLLAVATDAATGLPRAFNCLIGDAYIKLTSGHQANLAAEAFSALMIFPAGSDPNAVTATLRFDGMNYNLAPRVLALDNLASRAEGNDTLLVINRFGGDLATGAATIGAISGIIYDDAENALSFNFAPGVCQFRSSLSGTFPRTTPRLENFIPAGRTGWLKFYAAEDTALLGAALNHNPSQTSGAFSQGHNLHKLQLTNTASYVVPIIPSNCGD